MGSMDDAADEAFARKLHEEEVKQQERAQAHSTEEDRRLAQEIQREEDRLREEEERLREKKRLQNVTEYSGDTASSTVASKLPPHNSEEEKPKAQAHSAEEADRIFALEIQKKEDRLAREEEEKLREEERLYIGDTPGSTAASYPSYPPTAEDLTRTNAVPPHNIDAPPHSPAGPQACQGQSSEAPMQKPPRNSNPTANGRLTGPVGHRNPSEPDYDPSPVQKIPESPTTQPSLPSPIQKGLEMPKKGKKGFWKIGRMFHPKGRDDGEVPDIRFPIPEPVKPPPHEPEGPMMYTVVGSKDIPTTSPEVPVGRRPQILMGRKTAMCVVCKEPVQNPLTALGKQYHNDCFRCVTCNFPIDPTVAFAFTEDAKGNKNPMHRQCYSEQFGIKCCVCKNDIPADIDGKVAFVKHPFFDTEQMCPRHADFGRTRRCTGCHRFEPEDEPFADLNDMERCVCLACCRSVVVNSQDAQPLWTKVVDFFEHQLKLTIWDDFREVPILVVGYTAMNDQMNSSSSAHEGAAQIMTRGLCLTEHESGKRFKSNQMRLDRESRKFVACDKEERGFTVFQVPDKSKVNPEASVTAILCLSGLPSDLTASVLAHEATHAWLKLHPDFDFEKPIPPQVEEGCAQLIALLFLYDGLDPTTPLSNPDGTGPTDEKLRQYFQFSIESDNHDIYGTGFRKAARAYERIGIEVLLNHVALYQKFPDTNIVDYPSW